MKETGGKLINDYEKGLAESHFLFLLNYSIASKLYIPILMMLVPKKSATFSIIHFAVKFSLFDFFLRSALKTKSETYVYAKT